MELQLCRAAPPEAAADHPDRIAERKLDGVRVHTPGGRLVTRSGNDITASVPEVGVPPGLTLDGELVTTDFEFESAVRRVQTEDRFKVEMLAERLPARLVAFDILEADGEDLRDRPLTERKERLTPAVRSAEGVIEITSSRDPEYLWQTATAEGWEGIVIKEPSSPYRGERSDDWLKVKDWREGEFDVIGHEYTDNDGFVIYVDIGTDDPQKVAVNGEADRRAVEAGVDRAEVQYLERSRNDRLRKPSFRGVAA